jgi:hypothetical protein
VALKALSLSFLSYSNFGIFYPDACRFFGLEPSPMGYGLLHCLDDAGQRVTRATEDVEYVRMIASRIGTATLEGLEVPATKFPVNRAGWPEDWIEEHQTDGRPTDQHRTDHQRGWIAVADEPDPGRAADAGRYRLDVNVADLPARIRAICGSWPEVTERESHGAPAFYVKKQFVMLWPDGHHDQRFPHLWCAAPPGAQDEMIEMQPDRYFRPPYVGGRGWLGVRLDGVVDWDEVRALCAGAYRCVAPKRLVTLLPDDPA